MGDALSNDHSEVDNSQLGNTATLLAGQRRESSVLATQPRETRHFPYAGARVGIWRLQEDNVRSASSGWQMAVEMVTDEGSPDSGGKANAWFDTEYWAIV